MNSKLLIISLWLMWSAIIYCLLTAIEYASRSDYKFAFIWLCAGCVEYMIKRIFIDRTI